MNSCISFSPPSHEINISLNNSQYFLCGRFTINQTIILSDQQLGRELDHGAGSHTHIKRNKYAVQSSDL